jgi:hypothetical protein
MESAIASGLVVGAALAAVVCFRRMTLGQQMVRSLESLKTRPGRSTPESAVATPSAPVPLAVWSKSSFTLDSLGDRQGHRVDTRAITAPVLRPRLPRAS